MRLERRDDGSVRVRSSATLRAVIAALGLVVALALAAQAPREPLRLALGGLGVLVCLGFAALLERAEFDFDTTRRRVAWRRRNLFRALGGELGFAEIDGVAVRTRSDRDVDGHPRVLMRYYRVVLETRGGELPLHNAWTGDERRTREVADAIRAALAGTGARGA